MTFITPEAFKALTEYIVYRSKRRKEKVVGDSYLFASRFLKPLNEEALKQIFHRLVRRAGVQKGKRVRHEVSMSQTQVKVAPQPSFMPARLCPKN